MITQLLNILKEAIRRVPAMKYALAVAGIMAVVGLVGAFKISPQMAVFGAVIVLVLMVAVVIFARLTTVAPKHFFLPVQVMMWSFLVVVVATALMLFTCAFFRWPKALNELIAPRPVVQADQTKQSRDLIAGAHLQLGARDYAGAWKAVSEAVRLAPDFNEAREAQVLIAMAWLRDMRVSSPATFTETVNPLLECLYLSAAQAQGTRAADLHAHIGWANFLKWREGVRNLKIEEEYATAVKLEAANPFAHAMWGHWLATQHRPVPEVQEHFRTALKAGREREFVRSLQISALVWMSNLEGAGELVRLADEMRRNKEPLPTEARAIMFDAVYVQFGREKEQEIAAFLPGTEHLATFMWLTEGRDLDASGFGAYFRARLTEASGDHAKALSLYQAIRAGSSSFERQIKAGIKRCQQPSGAGTTETSGGTRQAGTGDTAARVRMIQSLVSGDTQAAHVLPTLVSCVRDESAEVRAASCDALVELGGRAVSNVVALLSSPKNRDVLNAARILGKIGQEPAVAVPALSQALQHADPEVIDAVVDALASFGPAASPAVPSLLEILAKTDEIDLQKSVAYALGEIGPGAQAGVPQLMQLLKSGRDPQGFLNNNAADALGKIGPEAAPAVPLLITALQSDDVRLPTRAAEALGNIGAGARPAIPALLDAMSASESQYRINYAEPLGKIATALAERGDTGSLPALKQALRAMELANLQPAVISPVREAVDVLKEKEPRLTGK